jgi:hypothetical protein
MKIKDSVLLDHDSSAIQEGARPVRYAYDIIGPRYGQDWLTLTY